MFFDKMLNLGISTGDDVNRVRLIRQINGLNLFYTFVALSVAFISFLFLRNSLGGFLLGWVQVFATILYASNLLVNRRKFHNFVRHSTLIFFELHLFLCSLLTGVYDSPVLLVFVLYPLLAALVEVSIFQHLFFGFIQFGLVLFFRFSFPDAAMEFNNLMGTAEDYYHILRIMGLFYFPVMGSVIMKIIFSENLKARIKQKNMIEELNRVHEKLKDYAEALKDESIRLKAEVNVAKDIQAMVLPGIDDISLLDEHEVACIMRPASEVGGDYYDIIKTDNELVFGIGDVTGHGLASGLIMMMAQTAIRALVESPYMDFKDYLPTLNSVLYANINRINANRNMTLSLVSYEGNGKYLSTGQHEFFLIYRSNTNSIEVNDTLDDGFFIGMLDSITTFNKIREFTLNEGDILLLFSDGITEAENIHGEQFGLERLIDNFHKYSSEPVEKIKDKLIMKIYNYIGPREILDDISLMVIKQGKYV